jgi:HEAT repeat protein
MRIRFVHTVDRDVLRGEGAAARQARTRHGVALGLGLEDERNYLTAEFLVQRNRRRGWRSDLTAEDVAFKADALVLAGGLLPRTDPLVRAILGRDSGWRQLSVGGNDHRQPYRRWLTARVIARGRQTSTSVQSRVIRELSRQLPEVSAVDGLVTIGAVDPLIRALRHPKATERHAQLRRVAAWALGRVPHPSREVIDVLIGALRDRDDFVRSLAIRSLEAMIRIAPTQIGEAIAACAGDRSWHVGQAVIAALPRLEDPSPPVLDALVSLMVRRGEARAPAIQALARHCLLRPSLATQMADTFDAIDLNEPTWEDVFPYADLLAQIANSDPGIARRLLDHLDDRLENPRRGAAASAIKHHLVRPSAEVLGILLAHLEHPKARVRDVIAETLGNLRDADPRVLVALAGRLDDQDWGVRQKAASALVSHHQAHPSVLRLLDAEAMPDLIGDVSPGLMPPGAGTTYQSAIEALAGDADPVAEMLRPFAFSRDGAEREVAREMLALLEATPGARERVTAALLEWLRTPEPLDVMTRTALVRILDQVGEPTNEVRLELLGIALTDEEEEIRGAAAAAFVRGGQPDDIVAARMLDWLRHPPQAAWAANWTVLERLTEVIGHLPAPLPGEQPLLVEHLTGQDDAIRRVAARTLGQHARADTEVVDALIACLDAPDSWVAIEAREALLAICQAEPHARRRLRAALGHPRSRTMAETLTYILREVG